MEVDPIEWDPNFAGLNPMIQYSLSLLRERCDKYQGFSCSPCPSWVTELKADKRENVRDAAKLALNIFNQKEQKNFNLEKVCKLNSINGYFCMTFRAKNAETDECHLFRGVVNRLSVLLCEIKEPDAIAILIDRGENYVDALSESKDNVDKREDVRDAAKLVLNIFNEKKRKNFNLDKVCKLKGVGRYFWMTFRAKNAETDECHLFRGVVDGWSHTVLLCEIMEPDDIAILIDRGENYVEALSESEDNVDKREDVRDAAKLALNIFNQKEQKNFNLEMVCNLSVIGGYFSMTFSAKNAETDECRHFRGVVHELSHTVSRCEILEPDEIELAKAFSESKEDHSPYRRKRARIEKDLGDDSVHGF